MMNNTPSSDFNFTNMMMRNESPTSDFLQQDETPSTTSSFLHNHHQQHHQQQQDDRSEQNFLEDDGGSHIHSHHPSNENSDDDSNFDFDDEMSEEAKAKLIQKHKEMKVKRGRKIKYENSICLECEEDGHKSQGGIWCYEVDHHKNNKRAPKYVNCDECHKLVSGPKYTRHLNKCAPSGASTATSNTNQTSTTLSSPGVKQGMTNNVIPVSGAVVSLAYDGGTISSNSNPHSNSNGDSNAIENQSNSSSLTMSSLNNQTSPRVIIGSQPVNQLHQNQMPNNQNNNNATAGMMNASAPTFVIMPNPASNSNNNNAFIQQLQQGSNANFMLNNTNNNLMAMINGIGLQQQSPHSPKSPGGSSTSLPTIVLSQQHNSTLQQQQQLINAMNRLSPQNNYPSSPNQLVQIAPGTFGMQPMNTPNYIINNHNGSNPVQSPQHIIITSPNNTSSSPGSRPLDNNAANQARAMTRLSPSLLVSAPVSPGQQQQFTKIIIPNAPTSPHQQQPQGIFQQFLPMEQQQNFLTTSSFTTNTARLSPSYQQALSPNQASWSGYDSSPGLSPGGQSNQNSAAQKKRKRNTSNAGSSQPSGSNAPSEGDYVEIRDDLLKKINDENDDNVYSLRLYNETTKQYTVLMSTVHKPVKQLCSSKKRKKLNQILAPVLAKFGVDAETLVQIKEVRSLIKNNKKPSSFANTNDNDSEDSDDQQAHNIPIHHQQQQQMLSQIVQPQQTMMGMLNDLGPTDIPQLPSDKDFPYDVPDFNLQHNFLNTLSDPQQQQPPNNE
ncbi:hypothetical protein C9374_001770 [Naegleria lovaniensis]|uniref:Uncharacterized protein n=1 Tax=Naegleria lovaniensis TaxID=51637 RepID=A0AA88GW62_NAELO|nr:uncharacterized protein C9374_001770 [Naegleria lovaniensis]KAG2387438.1 hypothetical protein C9374_001770 [Naegleria lovaniensis]